MSNAITREKAIETLYSLINSGILKESGTSIHLSRRLMKKKK